MVLAYLLLSFNHGLAAGQTTSEQRLDCSVFHSDIIHTGLHCPASMLFEKECDIGEIWLLFVASQVTVEFP